MATNWYFTNEELTRGLSAEDIKSEIAQRRSTCSFLQEAGMKLRLPQLTIATAVIFFHRFYARHRFRDYDRHAIATTSLFLAGKVEETPKKLRDVIEVTYMIRYKGKEIPKQDSLEFNQMREQILANELIVLQTIAFDLTVEHPYKYLLAYVKGIQGNRALAQVAWNFVNDSLRTTLCLQHRPQLIASAAIFLASKFLKYQIPTDRKPWWQIMDAKIEELEMIGNQILDLYDSTPNVDTIKSAATSFNDPEPKNYSLNYPEVLPNLIPNDNKQIQEIKIEKQNVSSQEKEKLNSSQNDKNSSSSSSSTQKRESPPRSRRSRSRSRSRSPRRDNRDRRDRDDRDRDRDKNRKDNRDRKRHSRSRSPRSKSRSRSRSPRKTGAIRNHDKEKEKVKSMSRTTSSNTPTKDGNKSPKRDDSSTTSSSSSSAPNSSSKGNRYQPY